MIAKIDTRTEDLRLLVHIVATGSLSAAARGLGLTQAVVTRRLQRLEAAVGAPLLRRTTRSLRTTRDGERLLRVAERVLAELASFEQERRSARATPSGDVRVSAPVLLGQVLGPALASALRRAHPGLRLVLLLANEKVDLVRSDVDVAIRVGKLPSTTLVGARIANAHVGAYAAPGLVARAKHPRDLLGSPWVGLPGSEAVKAQGPAGERWRASVRLSLVSDDRFVLRCAARAGMGVTLLPTFYGDEEPALARLVERWSFGTVPVHALWLPQTKDDPRVRAVVDAVLDWSSRQRW